MSNEKIYIKEIDNTTASTSVTDSTDIAFIPGLSILVDAPENEPVLCTTLKEFNDTFGSRPYKFTNTDIHDEADNFNYNSIGYQVGDYDRSYIYAKQLLSAGMPVLYSKVGPTKTYSLEERVSDAGFGLSQGESLAEDVLQGGYTIPEEVSTGIDMKIVFNVVAASQGVNYPLTITKLELRTDNMTPTPHTCSKGSLANEYILHVQTGISDFRRLSFIVTCAPIEGLDLTTAIITDTSTISYTAEIVTSNTDTSVITQLYENINTSLDLIKDKSMYSVKYITSGGYPSIGGLSDFAQTLIDIAKSRGDAVALIDYKMTKDKEVFISTTSEDDIYSEYRGVTDVEGYGAAMYPWSGHKCSAGYENITDAPAKTYMPASYSYLMCVASAIKTSPNWLAMAGVSRGMVPGIIDLYTKSPLTNIIAENLQPKTSAGGSGVSVNCITNIRPYGLTLWGNRTMKPVGPNGTIATNFLNTRNMLSDIKKVLYTTAKSLMFEQNTDKLWGRFKAGVSPLLDSLKTGGGISDYKIIKSTTTDEGHALGNGQLAAYVKIYPLYAVEYFELYVEINDSDVTVG